MDFLPDYKLVFEDEKQLLFREVESRRVLKFTILIIPGLFLIWPIFIDDVSNLSGLFLDISPNWCMLFFVWNILKVATTGH